MSAARPNRPGTFCLGSASPGAAGTKRHASPAQLTSQAICDLEEFADAQLRDAQAVGHLRWDHHLAGLDGPRRETEPSGWISHGSPVASGDFSGYAMVSRVFWRATCVTAHPVPLFYQAPRGVQGSPRAK